MKWLLISLICIIPTWGLEYSIVTTWDDQPVDHDPVNITLESVDDYSFKLSVNAPFFNDPPNPGGQVGEPFYGLWEYEVVELFLLNDEDQYVEIELCPWGQHIILLLDGYRHTIRHSLPLNFTVQDRSGGRWRGEAIIPADYLPVSVTKMNAYAIHGSGTERVYEALYPVPAANVTNETQADFHRLELFQPINMADLLPEIDSQSDIWDESLQGIRKLHIVRTWDGQPTGEPPVKFQIKAENADLVITMSAKFYNDSPPNGTAGNFWQLWNYEVVELFLLNDRNEYVEMEFGPWSHYLVLLLKGYRHTIAANLTVKYEAQVVDNYWNGTARIPLAYLPPQVTKCNAYAIHGPEENRIYSSLYPVSPNSNVTEPDFHLLQFFRALDLNVFLPENDNGTYSDIWQNAVDSDQTTAPGTTTAPTTTKSSGTILAGNSFLLILILAFV